MGLRLTGKPYCRKADSRDPLLEFRLNIGWRNSKTVMILVKKVISTKNHSPISDATLGTSEHILGYHSP